MSKVLEAMRKTATSGVELERRLKSIDRGNIFPVAQGDRAEEFVNLANSLANLATEGLGTIVVFASTTKGEGSSYVSYNCARYLTLLFDRKVAWVDANFRSPQKKIAGSELNLKSLLQDPEQLPEFDQEPELVVIGNGKKPFNSMELITGNAYPRLVRKLRESFFFTIIDAPPILESVEAGHLAQEALGLVVVVKSQGLKYEIINHGLEKLRAQNVNVLGTALNRRRFVLPDFVYRRL